MKQFEEYRELSLDFTDHLEHLEQTVINWGVRKYKADKVFAREQGAFMDLFEPFPRGYQASMVITWMFCRVLMDPDKLAKFARASKETLFPRQNHFLKIWKKEIPFWSLFTLEERLDKDLFRIRDYFGNRDLTICSSSLENLLKEDDIQLKVTPVICALFPLSEDLVVSYGIIRRYKCCRAVDIIHLYYFMSEELGWCDSFTLFVLKYYSRFFQMDQRMEAPMVFHKNTLMEKVFREVSLSDFEPEMLNDAMDTLVREPFVKFTPKGQEDFPFSEILWNRESQTLLIQSMSREGYDELVSHLVSFPRVKEPLLQLSYTLYSAVNEYMDLDLPDQYWTGLFSQEEADESPELADMNTLLGEAMEALNNNEDFDFQARGRELGMPDENIKSARDVVARLEKKLNN